MSWGKKEVEIKYKKDLAKTKTNPKPNETKNEKKNKKKTTKHNKTKKREQMMLCDMWYCWLINDHEVSRPFTIQPCHCTGIDPTRPDHADYLNHINDDFEQKMMKMIGSAISKRENAGTQEPLLQECLQHLEFCQRKSQAFGRSDDLQVERPRCFNCWISEIGIIEKN